MTGFVSRINTADQRIARDKKLPANLEGKSLCDTVESIKTKLSDAIRYSPMLWRCGVCSMAAKGKACQVRNREKCNSKR